MTRWIFRTGARFNVKLNQLAPAAILTKINLKCSWRLVQSPNDVPFSYSNSNWISMSFPKNFCPKITCKNKPLKICKDLAQLIFWDNSFFFFAWKSWVCVNSFCLNFYKLMSKVYVLFNLNAKAITSFFRPQKIILMKKKGANCDFSPTPENIGRNDKMDF